MKKEQWVLLSSTALFFGITFAGLSLAPDVESPAPHEQGIWPDVLKDVPEEEQQAVKAIIDSRTQENYGVEYIFSEVYSYLESLE